MLESFQVLLHEFRSLQQELGPWTTAFQEQHARRPRLADVERTGAVVAVLLHRCLDWLHLARLQVNLLGCAMHVWSFGARQLLYEVIRALVSGMGHSLL